MTLSGSAPPPGSRPSTGNPVARAHAEWKGGLLYEAGVGDRTHLIDGNSKQAPSPVETFLGAFGACAASDVIEILAKQRTPVERLLVDVLGVRRVEYPRRVMSLELMLTVDGKGIERDSVERAMALSIEKYCTVAASLAGDIELTTVIVLNGAEGAPVRHAMFSATFPRA